MSRAAAMLLLAMAGLLALALATGDEAIAPIDVLRALIHAETAGPAAFVIVNEVRLPRAVLALLVGAALGASGAIAQAVMRNPLAEPGILGINSGAALAALIVIVELDSPPARLLPWSAFAGGLAMALAIYLLAWKGGTSSIRIILVGIGLSAFAGAGAGFISAFGDVAAVQQAQLWLAGSLYRADWEQVRVLALWLLPPLVLVIAASRELDLLALGEETALALGQRVQLVGGLMILMMTLLAAAAVAAAGLIGFVGLIAPHAARRLVGRRNRSVVPMAALIGAALVLAADLAGRSLIAPAHLPAGLMTSLLGAPFFGYLLWRRRHVTS